MREDTGRESGLFKSVDTHVFLIDTRNKMIKWKPATHQLLSVTQYLCLWAKEVWGVKPADVTYRKNKRVKKAVKKKLVIWTRTFSTGLQGRQNEAIKSAYLNFFYY